MKPIPPLVENSTPYPDLPRFEGHIAAIFAHADDELGVGGQLAALGPVVQCVVVTDSARGFISPLLLKGRNKAELRWAELNASTRALGLPAPRRLGLPDGGLRSVPDLAPRLWDVLLTLQPLGAVFTHDVCGLYGHADHLAVYDAVRQVLAGRNIPLVAQALPCRFQRFIRLRAPARGRRRAPITHKFDMPVDIQRRKTAATLAHRSQRHVFIALMQGRSPSRFYRTFPREFFTVEYP